jgi:hypothetical protein
MRAKWYHWRMSEKKAGRPTVITNAAVQKLETAFVQDFTVEEACAFANISRSTYYDERGRNQAFSDTMDRAMRFPAIAAKQCVNNAIVKGNAYLAFRWLERRQAELYGINEHPPITEQPVRIDHLEEARRRAAKFSQPPQAVLSNSH